MRRNFDNRVEVACPVFDKKIQKEIKDMLDIQLKDNTKARLLNYNRYNHYKTTPGKKNIRSQVEIYNYLKSLE
jgi:polyphosphate kinase